MRTRPFLPLIAATAILVGALSGWMWKEHARLRASAQAELERTADMVSAALEGTVSSQVRRGMFQPDRVQAILEHAAEAAGLVYVALSQDSTIALHTGTLPAGGTWNGQHGTRLDGAVFHHWQTVRLQDCPRGLQRGRGAGESWQTAKPGESSFVREQVLAIGLNASPYFESVAASEQRLALNGALAVISLVILLTAWGAAIRNRELASELSAVRARAVALEEMSLAAAGLAHEVKNPLGIVRGQAQRLGIAAHDPDAVRRTADTVVDEIDKAIDRLSDFMAYARPRRPDIERFDVQPFLQQTVAVLEPEFRESNVAIQLQAVSCMIQADPQLLQQVLANLLLNSLRAVTPDSSQRVVSLGVEHAGNDGTVGLFVRDWGCGIDPEVKANLFKPYVAGIPGGHGLGLAVVKRIVDAHGWNIAVESQAGEGTVVRISGIKGCSDVDR